jgi:polyisoprenoid-binding protein YceI
VTRITSAGEYLRWLNVELGKWLKLQSQEEPQIMTNSPFDPATTVIEDIAGDYTLDVAHTRLGFSARHAMVTTVRGAFKEFEGTARVDTANPANSKVELTIKADSIDTGVADRDAHLRSADFFEIESHPEITFTSTNVERDGDDWTITGDLTITGTTKPISIEFESTGSARDPFGNLRIGFEGSTTLSRKEWGLTWNAALETGGFLVSDKIKLEFDISAIQK